MSNHLGLYVTSIGDEEIKRAGGETQAMFDADMDLFASLRMMQQEVSRHDPVVLIFSPWKFYSASEGLFPVDKYVRIVHCIRQENMSVEVIEQEGGDMPLMA